MSELEIPDRAWELMNGPTGASLSEAVRVIVAAELRRIVKLEGDDIKSWRLLKRADELDPPEVSNG